VFQCSNGQITLYNRGTHGVKGDAAFNNYPILDIIEI